MWHVVSRLFGRRPAGPPPVEDERRGSEAPCVTVQVCAGAPPVTLTLDEVRACGTVAELLRRAEERSRPDPADFKGRPIGDYLRARGVPEDTSRYAREEGVTTLLFNLGRRRPAEDAVRDRDSGTT